MKRRLLTLSICLMMAMLSFAHDFVVDHIYYNITSSTEPYTVAVTYLGSSYGDNRWRYERAIVIPETVTYNDKTYSVTSIGKYAFYGCEDLTSVSIPNSVTSIGNNAFSGCSGLTSIIIPNSVTSIETGAFSKCYRLTSVTIPNSVTSIGTAAFYDCSGLTSITIPNSVTSINSNAFSGCSNLTSITSCNQNPPRNNVEYGLGTLPNNITLYVPTGTKEKYQSAAGWKSFTNIKEFFELDDIYYSLTSTSEPYTVAVIGRGEYYINYSGAVTVPETFTNSGKAYYVTSIGSCAFNGCTGLTSINVPSSVTTIGSSAFEGCSGLKSVYIPSSVTSIGKNAFEGCSGLEKVIVKDLAAWCKVSFYNYTANPLYYAKHIYSDENTEITDLVIPNSVTSIGSYAFYGCSSLTVTLPDDLTSIGNNAFYVKKVLVNRGTPVLIALWNSPCTPNQIGTEADLPAPYLTVTGQTQTTLSYKIENWYDDYEYNYNSNVSKTFRKSTFYDNSLAPNSSGGTVYVRVPGTKSPEYSFKSSARTLPFNTSLGQTAKTASSLSLKGMYSEGDAVVTKQVLSVGGKSVEGNEISLKGLTPNSSYSAKYVVTITYGNKQTRDYIKEVKYNTDPLTLTTEQPKVVSKGNVIVSAKANVDDEEENVGFEWRRTDWTSDFASNTGTANMYEGTMEGYIRNLNTDKLWKFRPYYLANDGTYYYGDWIGLDPTNTSYFEPTVHTYAKIDVTGNTALVKGYALGGTDNITVQGFKYWKATNLARTEYGDRADVTAVTIPANAQTIEAEGRVMEATLSGLDYESTYYYVAFAKTAEGTYYGDVKTFTTGVNTGIERIENEQLTNDNAVSRRVKGIYTLTGVKVSDDAADVKTLKSGIYIVNGSKIAIK